MNRQTFAVPVALLLGATLLQAPDVSSQSLARLESA